MKALIEQVPLTAELEPARAVIFWLAVDSGATVTIVNNGRLDFLTSFSAWVCEATVVLQPGRLSVIVQTSLHRYYLMDYRVAKPLPLLEQLHRWPANVAYLLGSGGGE